MKLSGIFVSLVTPFDHRGSIYVSKMHHNIELMNQTNVSGYIVGGAAGEGALLSSEERIALWECAAATAGESDGTIQGVCVSILESKKHPPWEALGASRQHKALVAAASN